MSNVKLKEVSEIKDTSNNVINEVLTVGGKLLYVKKKAVTDLGNFGSITADNEDEIIYRVKSNNLKTKIGVYRFNRRTLERDVSYFWHENNQWNVSNISIPSSYPGYVTWYITDSGVLLINCHSVPNNAIGIMPGDKWSCNVEDLGTGYDTTVKCRSYYANMKAASPSFTQMSYCNDGQYEITYTSFVDDTTGYLYRLRLKRSSGGEESPGRLVISQSYPSNTGWVETEFEYYLTTDYYYSSNVGLLLKDAIHTIAGKTPGNGLVGVWCSKDSSTNTLTIRLLDSTSNNVITYDINVLTSYTANGSYGYKYTGMYGSTSLYYWTNMVGTVVADSGTTGLTTCFAHGTNFAGWDKNIRDTTRFNSVTGLYSYSFDCAYQEDPTWNYYYNVSVNGNFIMYRSNVKWQATNIDNIFTKYLYTKSAVRLNVSRIGFGTKASTVVGYNLRSEARNADMFDYISYNAYQSIFLITSHGIFDIHDGKLVFIDV